MALLMGYDVGSSSIKAALIDAETGETIALATLPKTEIEPNPTLPDNIELGIELHYDTEVDEKNAEEIAGALAG